MIESKIAPVKQKTIDTVIHALYDKTYKTYMNYR